MKYLLLMMTVFVIISCDDEIIVNQTETKCLSPEKLISLDKSFNDFIIQDGGENVIIINQESLLKLMVTGNIPYLQSVLNLRQAKLELDLARKELLPKISLDAIVGSIVNPTFLISTVNATFPFLVPGRWFNVKRQKALLKADETAFKITGLNQYASILSFTVTLHNYMKTKAVLDEQVQGSIELFRIATAMVELGQASEQDLDQSKVNVLEARERIFQTDLFLASQLANFRQAVGVCPEARFKIEEMAIEVTQAEELQWPQAAKLFYDNAPEALQLDLMIKAAKQDRWSNFYSFISGVNASRTFNSIATNTSSSRSFEGSTASGGLIFDATRYPLMRLSENQIDQLKLRLHELELEINNTTEDIFRRLNLLKQDYTEIQKRIEILTRIRDTEILRFKEGVSSFEQVLLFEERLGSAFVELYECFNDLNLLRIQIQRLTQSGGFSKVPSCFEYKKYRDGDQYFWSVDYKNKKKICDPELIQRRILGTIQKKIK